MTGGEIPAGDDLDRLIHERVLGRCAHQFQGTGTGAIGWDIYTCTKCGQRIQGVQDWQDRDWYGRYSTDIADAWAVVTALAGAGRYTWSIAGPERSGPVWWAALIGSGNTDDYEASGATAPEAICRVALLAVGGGAQHD